MKVRIIPAYIGWQDITAQLRGRELYYASIKGKSRNTRSGFILEAMQQRMLSSKLARLLITSSPSGRSFTFRKYLFSKNDNMWILDRIIKELLARLDYTYCYDETEDADINYYVNWHAYTKKTHALDVAFFTHCEDSQCENFVSCARQLDFSICMSRKYRDMLLKEGISSTDVISVGIDTELFHPKLIIGYAGGIYSARKGLDILGKLRKLDWVELRLTEGKLPYGMLPDFYRELDYALVPSRIEGGPMCLVESLACGKEVIAPKDVGAVAEYEEGIIHYEKGNFESLKSVLQKLYDKKMKISHQMSTQTWKNFTEQHDRLFRSLVSSKKEGSRKG